MQISGWIKASTLDYPGQLASVVFTTGCNYACPWCHNKETYISQIDMSDDDILAYLKKRQGILDGVVISGGEPTMQPGLLSFAARVKELGLLIKLDTNGSKPKVIQDLLREKAVDYIAMDYKAPFYRYPQICRGSADGKSARQTLDLLYCGNVDFELRTTVLKQLSMKDLCDMASCIPELPLYALQLYRPQNGENAPNEAKWIHDAVRRIKIYQPNAIARA